MHYSTSTKEAEHESNSTDSHSDNNLYRCGDSQGESRFAEDGDRAVHGLDLYERLHATLFVWILQTALQLLIYATTHARFL